MLRPLKTSWILNGLATTALAATMMFGAVGCSDDGPTEPRGASTLTEEEMTSLFDAESQITFEDAATDREGTGDRWSRLVEALGLSERQLVALRDAHQELDEAMKALRSSYEAGEISREQASIRARSLRENFETRLREILTEEQYRLLQELRNGHTDSPDGDHGDDSDSDGDTDPSRAYWDRLARVLRLTDAQLDAILTAETATADRVREVHRRLETGELGAEEARRLIRDLRARFESRLQEILTAEQWRRLLDIRNGSDDPRDPDDNGDPTDDDPTDPDDGNDDGGDDDVDPDHDVDLRRWERIAQALGLSEDQFHAVIEIERFRLQAIREVRVALASGEMTGEEARARMQQITNRYVTALESILTSEQWEHLRRILGDEIG